MDLLSNIFNRTIASQITESKELLESADSGPVAQFRAFMETGSTLEQESEGGNTLPASGNNLPAEEHSVNAENTPAIPPPGLPATAIPEVDVDAGNGNFQQSSFTALNNWAGRADQPTPGPEFDRVVEPSQSLGPMQAARVTNPAGPGLRLDGELLSGYDPTQQAVDRLQPNHGLEQPQAAITARYSHAESSPIVSGGFEPQMALSANISSVVAPVSLTQVQTEALGPSSLRVPARNLTQFQSLAADSPDLIRHPNTQVPLEVVPQPASELQAYRQPAIAQFNELDEFSLQRTSAVEFRTLPVESAPTIASSRPPQIPGQRTENLASAGPTVSAAQAPLPAGQASNSEVTGVASTNQPALLRDLAVDRPEIARTDNLRVTPEPVTTNGVTHKRPAPPIRGASLAISATSPIDVRPSLTTKPVPFSGQIVSDGPSPKPAVIPDTQFAEKAAITDRSGTPLGSFERWVGHLRPQVPASTVVEFSSLPEVRIQAPGIVSVPGRPSPQLPASRPKAGEPKMVPQATPATSTLVSEARSDLRANTTVPIFAASGLPVRIPATDSGVITSQPTVLSNAPEPSVAGNLAREVSFGAVHGPAPTSAPNATPPVSVPTGNAPSPQPLSLTDPDFSLQFSQQTVSAAKTELQKVEIRLNPASLGSIRVEIEQTERGASVQFQVNNAAAKEAVELSLPKLREMFESNGLKLSDSQVGQQQDRTGNSEKGRQSHEFAHGQASDSELQENPKDQQSASKRRSDSQIDTFV